MTLTERLLQTIKGCMTDENAVAPNLVEEAVYEDMLAAGYTEQKADEVSKIAFDFAWALVD
jgi:hypothetical protein